MNPLLRLFISSILVFFITIPVVLAQEEEEEEPPKKCNVVVTVVDCDNNPVLAAKVYVKGLPGQCNTDAEGHCVFILPEGRYLIMVEKGPLTAPEEEVTVKCAKEGDTVEVVKKLCKQ